MEEITKIAQQIKHLCENGKQEDICCVLNLLNENTNLPTTKIIDYYLGTVSNPEGVSCIEHFLFNGSQIQRNYCTLFFSRRNEWNIVNRAFNLGLIDYIQAYSR